MNIPEKAIRAAADAMLDDVGLVAALEAAAPFIAAQALREAADMLTALGNDGFPTPLIRSRATTIESEAPNA